MRHFEWQIISAFNIFSDMIAKAPRFIPGTWPKWLWFEKICWNIIWLSCSTFTSIYSLWNWYFKFYISPVCIDHMFPATDLEYGSRRFENLLRFRLLRETFDLFLQTALSFPTLYRRIHILIFPFSMLVAEPIFSVHTIHLQLSCEGERQVMKKLSCVYCESNQQIATACSLDHTFRFCLLLPL